MTRDDFNKSLLLLLVYREARGEGPDGMRAVAHVVRNRVSKGWGDWIGVMTKPNQFSSLSVLGDGQTIVWPAATNVDSLTDMVESVYSGSDEDPTNGALYYANEVTATSGWYKTNIIDSGQHPVTLHLGHHTFRA